MHRKNFFLFIEFLKKLSFRKIKFSKKDKKIKIILIYDIKRVSLGLVEDSGIEPLTS